MFQILTNQAPYSGPKAYADAMEGRFSKPRKVNKQVPRALEAICLKAMQPDPKSRYESVKDLKSEIERYLADIPVLACRDNFHESAQRFVRRHKTTVSVTCVMLLAIAGLLAYFLTQSYFKNRELEKATQKAVAATGEAKRSAELASNRATEALVEKRKAKSKRPKRTS